MARHVFKLDDGETHWYAADSMERAKEMHIEALGGIGLLPCDVAEVTVEQLPDEQLLKIRQVDEAGSPVEAKPCREWAADGEGLVGSTVW